MLEQIMTIEQAAFTAEQAASKSAMQERIEKISDTFLVALEGEKVLGYIVGPASKDRYITDELFEEVLPNQATDEVQTVLSLATAEEARGKGIASSLLLELKKVAQMQERKIISLTCLEELIPFYEKHTYLNEGIANSEHAGDVWYNMILDLS